MNSVWIEHDFLLKQRLGDPSLYYFMSKHVLLSWKNLTEGRACVTL